MQRNMSWLMSWMVVPEGSGNLALECLEVIENALFGPILAIIIIFMFGYAVVKVFLSGLKRGGILLIQVAVGSLYMFSVPRGFTDGFIMWIKQVIALCLTTFLQSVMMVCGLILFKDQWLMGFGVMLVAGEIPQNCRNVRAGNRSTSEYKRRYKYSSVGGASYSDDTHSSEVR